MFLLKNTTSRLQPLDAGIIQNFKVKYRKSLVKDVLSRINDNASVAEIVQDVNIIMAIQWVQRAWKDVTPLTVKRCFEKSGFSEGDDELMEDVDVDEEFSALVKELSSDVSPDEYVDFDAELATAESGIKIDTLGWRQKARDKCNR